MTLQNVCGGNLNSKNMTSQTSISTGTKFQINNFNNIFIESLDMQARIDEMTADAFIESLDMQARIDEMTADAFIESLDMQAELEAMAAEVFLVL